MKLSFALLALTFCPQSRGKWHLRHLEEEYGFIASDDFYDPNGTTAGACIDVKDNKPRMDQKLILGTCQGRWRFDDHGLVHTNLDDAMCIQAGRIGPVSDGEFARLFPCDPSNELQKFYFVNGGGIRPQSDTSLCMVWRGVHANVGADPIIFKDCRSVEDRNDWSGDFPRDDYQGPL